MIEDSFDDEDDDDDDEFDHFTDAQDTVWDAITGELTQGRKTTHWMWFVFPVLEGISESTSGMFFALRDVAEARDFMNHPVLAGRLTTCMGLLLLHTDKSAADILGDTDAWKLHNCATLFARAADDPTPFTAVLDRFFDGKPAARTLDILGAP